MATLDDVRRIALALPGATVSDDGNTFAVGGKTFAWPWLERVDPKRARVPNRDVLAVRVAAESEKEVLIEMDPAVFFTERHHDGYPAILVRLPVAEMPLLERLLEDAWRTRVPKGSRAR